MEDPDYDYDRVRRRMKNIDNLKILPLDLDVVIQWSPARELWKVMMMMMMIDDDDDDDDDDDAGAGW